MGSTESILEPSQGNGDNSKLIIIKVLHSKPLPIKEFNKEERVGEFATQLYKFKESDCGAILDSTSFETKNLLPAKNGFVDAALKMYCGHHHLLIRPNDIWLAIMTQFSFYVNARAEELRSHFVSFEGKKTLTVFGPSNIFDTSYDAFVIQMEELIHQNLVNPEVRDWIMPSFSTTTENDIVTSTVVFMAIMKEYFNYESSFICDIPSMNYKGTENDWENIRRRLDMLDTYGLREWADFLRPILVELENMTPRKHTKFLNRMCQLQRLNSTSYCRGWITALCRFNENGEVQEHGWTSGKWARLNINDIPSGIVQVDVVVTDNGTRCEAIMLAGSMGITIVEEDTLLSKPGWVIALKNKTKLICSGQCLSKYN